MRSITGLFLLTVLAVPAAVYQIGELTSFELKSLAADTTANSVTETTKDGVIGFSERHDPSRLTLQPINNQQEMEAEKNYVRGEQKVEKLSPLESADKNNLALTPLQRINTMSLETWMEIKGIGQVTAERILKFKNENKGFASLDTLLEVKGIGPSKYAAILEWLERQNETPD
ncbi:ComEA family DNA-binding protein [Acidaminobacter sp.]|uniref:ComEA family DNA-binding protein n=1 Tax=Acidaminobacter sp. TaxID=1872102 RepID=UPI00137F9006|nr:helix-hairpin-helix domain-containing protein [Acidaminobacter sp.]MDK9709766.1 helix-hairpin-helix domain-containing protein [Acidaminobacter sp.]MZQ96877.1 hypothetical protein [Acidaminobacter sp.]